MFFDRLVPIDIEHVFKFAFLFSNKLSVVLGQS